MTDAVFQFIIARIVKNAKDSIEDAKQNKNDDFYNGKRIAYYEVLDTIKSELVVRDQELKNFGLDIDLEKEFL